MYRKVDNDLGLKTPSCSGLSRFAICLLKYQVNVLVILRHANEIYILDFDAISANQLVKSWNNQQDKLTTLKGCVAIVVISRNVGL